MRELIPEQAADVERDAIVVSNDGESSLILKVQIINIALMIKLRIVVKRNPDASSERMTRMLKYQRKTIKTRNRNMP